MYGDFSRVRDGLAGDYSGVLAQQGRLLLDAELNEQSAIVLGYLRQLVTDLVGPYAGPSGHAGFAVSPTIDDDKCRAVKLGAGHYYVFGRRCSSPGPHRSEDDEIPIGEHELPFIAYLVVWEQSVSALQAPELRDPALGPGIPDSSRRSQVRWHVDGLRHLPGSEHDLTSIEPEQITEAFAQYSTRRYSHPLLGARAHTDLGTGSGPDAAPSAHGYRGVENQLYRVEIHHGGDAGDATFKWSRDNGSVEFALAELSEATGGVRTAKLERGWIDERMGLDVGDWVELVDDDWAPLGQPTPLMQVTGVSLAAREVQLADTDGGRAFHDHRHPLLRRWDQQPENEGAADGIPVEATDGSWFELEDGVQILFKDPSVHYQRGDYWLIPARTDTGGVLWSESTDPDDPGLHAHPPAGPRRFLAPLALVRQPDALTDLRTRFARMLDAPEEAGPTGDSDLDATQDVHPAPALIESPPPSVIPPVRSYRVRSVSSVGEGSVWEIHDGSIVGRERHADISIDSRDVSRRHAEFGLRDGDLLITDLGSTNHTKVNDTEITAHTPTRVAPGDLIELGTPAVQLQVEEI